MDLDGNHRILKIRLRLPDLGLSWIIRRVSFRVPNAVMGSNRPNPVELNASVGCNIPHDEHLPDGHFVFRGLVTLENGINPDTHHVDAVVCFDRTSNSITVSFSRPLVSAFLAPGAGFMAVVIASKIVKSTILL